MSILKAEEGKWKSLQVFENQLKIFGAVRENRVWKRRHHQELVKFYKRSDALSKRRVQGMKWVGHVWRTGKRRCEQILETEVEGVSR